MPGPLGPGAAALSGRLIGQAFEACQRPCQKIVASHRKKIESPRSPDLSGLRAVLEPHSCDVLHIKYATGGRFSYNFAAAGSKIRMSWDHRGFGSKDIALRGIGVQTFSPSVWRTANKGDGKTTRRLWLAIAPPGVTGTARWNDGERLGRLRARKSGKVWTSETTNRPRRLGGTAV